MYKSSGSFAPRVRSARYAVDISASDEENGVHIKHMAVILYVVRTVFSSTNVLNVLQVAAGPWRCDGFAGSNDNFVETSITLISGPRVLVAFGYPSFECTPSLDQWLKRMCLCIKVAHQHLDDVRSLESCSIVSDHVFP